MKDKKSGIVTQYTNLKNFIDKVYELGFIEAIHQNIQFNTKSGIEYFIFLEWYYEYLNYVIIQINCLDYLKVFPKKYTFYNLKENKIYFKTLEDFALRENLDDKYIKTYLINERRKSYKNWRIIK